MDLFSLVASLVLDSSKYEAGIGQAEQSAEGLKSTLGGKFATAAKVAAGAVAAVGAAAGAAAAVVSKEVGALAQYGDNIDKQSQKLGISAKAYQEWDAVLQHSGTSIESMGIGMKTLATKAAEGSDAFKALGISQQAAAGMSREDLFSQTITALQNVQDANQRAQLAQELFGRSAMELGPLLNTSAADTQAMKDRVNELGGVMSDEAVKAAAAYQDSLQDMQTALNGAKRNLLSQFLPAMTTVMDGIADLMTGKGTGKITEGIGQFMDKLGEMLPVAMDMGTDILIALAEGIIDGLPNLVDKAPAIVEKLIAALIRLAPKLLEAGAKIVISLANGILSALSYPVEAIFSFIERAGTALHDMAASAWEWGKDMILSFFDGIVAFISKPIDAVRNLAKNIWSMLHFSEPEEGPLKDFGTYAPDMMRTFAQGITDNRGLVTDAINGAFGVRPQIMGGEAVSVPRGGAGGPTTLILQLNDTEIGRVLLPYIRAEEGRVGVNLATGGAY